MLNYTCCITFDKVKIRKSHYTHVINCITLYQWDCGWCKWKGNWYIADYRNQCNWIPNNRQHFAFMMRKPITLRQEHVPFNLRSFSFFFFFSFLENRKLIFSSTLILSIFRWIEIVVELTSASEQTNERTNDVSKQESALFHLFLVANVKTTKKPFLNKIGFQFEIFNFHFHRWMDKWINVWQNIE